MNRIILLLCLNCITQSILGQSIELQGISSIDCNGQTYCLSLEVRSGDPGTVFLGSSSIFFQYDPLAISYQSFTSATFDTSTNCSGNFPWDIHTYDPNKPGKFSMTMILKNGEELNSCPELTPDTWVKVGDVCFTILDDTRWVDIHFDPNLTSFNENTMNNGNSAFTISKMQVQGATCQPDIDLDGVPDSIDNCIDTSNPFQEDDDHDEKGNACDTICNISIFSIPDLTICKGSTAVLSAFSNDGMAPYTYAWSNGSNEGNVEVEPTNPSTFRVTITDDNGCVGLDSVEVGVTEGFLDDLIIYDIDSGFAFDTIQNGDTFYLSSLPFNYNIEALVSGDVESVGFILSGSDFDTDTENGAPYRYKSDTSPLNLEAGEYSLDTRIYSENNQLGSSCDFRLLNFTILDDCAKIDLGGDRVHCEGDTTIIEADVTTIHGAYFLNWSTGSSAPIISITPTMDEIYTVSITDNTHCASEFSIEVEVTDAKVTNFYIWDTAADTIVRMIQEGDIFLIDEFPPSWNILTEYTGGVDRVDYALRGDSILDYVEYNVPYHLGGDNTNIDLGVGSYVLTAVPKETHNITSIGCGPFSKSFQILDSIGCSLVTTTLDSLPGSLNYALTCSNPGETIYFDSKVFQDTIRLVNHIALIDKEITISAIPEQMVFIQGVGTNTVFNISSNTNATIRGLHIIPANASIGSAIINQGTLKLENVTIHDHPTQLQTDVIQSSGMIEIQGMVRVKMQE